MPVSAPTSPSPCIAGVESIVESIVETDGEIRAALADAVLPPLPPALAYLTGDMSLLRDDRRPDPLLITMPQGGFIDEQQEAVRATALKVLDCYRDGGCRPAAPPSDADLQRILEHTVGGMAMADYLPLLEERSSPTGARIDVHPRGRWPSWHRASTSRW